MVLRYTRTYHWLPSRGVLVAPYNSNAGLGIRFLPRLLGGAGVLAMIVDVIRHHPMGYHPGLGG